MLEEDNRMRAALEGKGPPKEFLFGHWRLFERDRLGFLRDCYRTCGDTTRLQIIFPTLLINDPADIQHVLVSREENYRKSFRVTGRVGRRLFANGLLTRHGAGHRRQRRLVQPGFQRHAITAFFEAVRVHIDRMLEGWLEKPVVDISAEMDRFSEGALIRAVLGELDEATLRQLCEANRARRRFINHAFKTQFPLPELLPTRLNWQYQRAVRSQTTIVRKLVSEARVRAVTSDEGPPSLLSVMAAARTSGGDCLSEDDLFDEVWELLTAGYETSREGLTWALYLMAKHPDQAARLRAEVEHAVGGRAVRVDDLPQLVHAEMFFSEALRLFPPAWMFVRVAIQNGVLPSGVAVRAGSKIFLCPYTAHRSERFFPDPEVFDPNRFHPDLRHVRPKFAYFPFGGGPRVCVAEALARLEGVLMLASLARKFDIRLCPGQDIEPVGAITLRPKNPIRVEARPVAIYERGSQSLRPAASAS